MNVIDGKITYQAVADAHGLPYTPLARRRAVGRVSRSRARAGPPGTVSSLPADCLADWDGEILTTAYVTAAERARMLHT